MRKVNFLNAYIGSRRKYHLGDVDEINVICSTCGAITKRRMSTSFVKLLGRTLIMVGYGGTATPPFHHNKHNGTCHEDIFCMSFTNVWMMGVSLYYILY